MTKKLGKAGKFYDLTEKGHRHLHGVDTYIKVVQHCVDCPFFCLIEHRCCVGRNGLCPLKDKEGN